MDLYPAQIDGIDLEIETIADAIEKSIARHEYPYKHGALLEDLGERARVVRIRCWFWDDGADHQTYDAHLDLQAGLEGMEIVELVHPKYGPMRGCIEAVSIRHDDRDRVAEIDLTFVEGLIEDSDDTAGEDVEAGSEEAYIDGIEEQKSWFSDGVFAALGSEAGAILNTVLDPALGIVEQFSSVSTTARGYLKTVESYVGTLEGTLNAIANPANGLVSLINYGTGLPGRVVGSLARCMERYALAADGLRTAPSRYADSLAMGLNALSTASGDFTATTQTGGAAHIALQMAGCYKEDEERRRQRLQAEKIPAFDTQGNYRRPAFSATDPQPMTVRELEASLATVRGLIQTAVDRSRQTDSLKRQAELLQRHVGTIKLERERTVRVRLDNNLPLHIICLMHGLPYSAAERILAINQIKNPNEVNGEVLIYAD